MQAGRQAESVCTARGLTATTPSNASLPMPIHLQKVALISTCKHPGVEVDSRSALKLRWCSKQVGPPARAPAHNSWLPHCQPRKRPQPTIPSPHCLCRELFYWGEAPTMSNSWAYRSHSSRCGRPAWQGQSRCSESAVQSMQMTQQAHLYGECAHARGPHLTAVEAIGSPPVLVLPP